MTAWHCSARVKHAIFVFDAGISERGTNTVDLDAGHAIDDKHWSIQIFWLSMTSMAEKRFSESTSPILVGGHLRKVNNFERYLRMYTTAVKTFHWTAIFLVVRNVVSILVCGYGRS
jgi:hypothetical protein